MTNRLTTFRVFGSLTLLSLIVSLGCWLWAIYQRDEARNELSRAIARGDYEASARNDWPALDWFIAAFVSLLFALIAGVIALIGRYVTKMQAAGKGPTSDPDL